MSNTVWSIIDILAYVNLIGYTLAKYVSYAIMLGYPKSSYPLRYLLFLDYCDLLKIVGINYPPNIGKLFKERDD